MADRWAVNDWVACVAGSDRTEAIAASGDANEYSVDVEVALVLANDIHRRQCALVRTAT